MSLSDVIVFAEVPWPIVQHTDCGSMRRLVGWLKRAELGGEVTGPHADNGDNGFEVVLGVAGHDADGVGLDIELVAAVH